MSDNIAKAANFRPFNMWMLFNKTLREATDHFADDYEVHHRSIKVSLVFVKLVSAMIVSRVFKDFVNRIQHGDDIEPVLFRHILPLSGHILLYEV